MTLKSRLDRLERRFRASIVPDDPDRRRRLASRLLLFPEHGPDGVPLTDEERAEAEAGLAEMREEGITMTKRHPVMALIRRERQRLEMPELTDAEERVLIESHDDNGMINTAIRLAGMRKSTHSS